MYKHEQGSSSSSAEPRVTQAPPSLSENELKQKIPLLQTMDQTNPKFQKLIQLLQEIPNTTFDRSKKYELMYKIIEIGNLFEVLCPTMKNQKTAEVVQDCKTTSNMDMLTPAQQLSLFEQARNVTADSFHSMYEQQARELYGSVSSLCQGKNSASKLLSIDDVFQPVSRGSSIQKVLGRLEPENKKINKLFCQMGYYLKKADDYLKSNNHEAAAMALIGAGNCARNFNWSKLNPKKVGSVTALLNSVRNDLAHLYLNEVDSLPLSENMRQIVEKRHIEQGLELIKSEASQMDNPVDIDAYYAKRELQEGLESPKAYELSDLRMPKVSSSTDSMMISASHDSRSAIKRSAELASRREEVHELEVLPLTAPNQAIHSDPLESVKDSASSANKKPRIEVVPVGEDEKRPLDETQISRYKKGP
ncbi:MAG: hypothetical protein AB7F64_07745 [Gammaproteobacteria bacterium]